MQETKIQSRRKNKYKNSRSLEEKIRSRRSTVAVIGLGYVGFPLAIAFRDAGFPVKGIDLDPKKLKALREKDTLNVTSDYGILGRADVIIICVPRRSVKVWILIFHSFLMRRRPTKIICERGS